MTSQHTIPVTVLGLGPMGSALARAFLAAGHSTTVWNRTPSRADPLVAAGARRAASVADAVAASPLVLVCVIDYDAVHAILDPAADELRGKTVLNLTADSPDRARAAAAWAQEHGIGYIDGSIMTPTSTIGRPEAVVLYSGPEELYTRYRPALAALGGTGTYLGADSGRAASYDVALLDMYWTGLTGLVHGLALAQAEGIPASELLPFAEGIVDILRDSAAVMAKDADRRQFPGDEANLASAVTGMSHVIHAAQARGIDASVLRAAVGIGDRAVTAGYGSDGFARLVDVLGR